MRLLGPSPAGALTEYQSWLAADLIAPAAAARVIRVGVCWCCHSIIGEGDAAIPVGVATTAKGQDAKAALPPADPGGGQMQMQDMGEMKGPWVVGARAYLSSRSPCFRPHTLM